MVQLVSLLLKISSTCFCLTVREIHFPLLHLLHKKYILLLLVILCIFISAVSSQSKTVNAVGECVWTHYLTVSEKTGRGGGFPLSAAQQQEVWVQYTALQVALQVRIHCQALVSVFKDEIKFTCLRVICLFFLRLIIRI